MIANFQDLIRHSGGVSTFRAHIHSLCRIPVKLYTKASHKYLTRLRRLIPCKGHAGSSSDTTSFTLNSNHPSQVSHCIVSSLKSKVHTSTLWAETLQKIPDIASKAPRRITPTPTEVSHSTTYCNWLLAMRIVDLD